MPTDTEKGNKKLQFEEETYAIIGAAMEVHSTIGHGFLEKIYENALAREFDLRGIPYDQQRSFEVRFKDITAGEFIPDFVVFDNIIVETKVIPRITEYEHGQILNYLKVTKFKIGVIINFSQPRLQWQRLAL